MSNRPSDFKKRDPRNLEESYLPVEADAGVFVNKRTPSNQLLAVRSPHSSQHYPAFIPACMRVRVLGEHVWLGT